MVEHSPVLQPGVGERVPQLEMPIVKLMSRLVPTRVKRRFRVEKLSGLLVRPWKIPSAIQQVYRDVLINLKDVKLRPLSTEYRLTALNASVSALATLARTRRSSHLSVRKMDEVFDGDPQAEGDRSKLAQLFRDHGSDKSTNHNYYVAYASLLMEKTDRPINILEIGVGTNYIDTLSNMGIHGRPGASLRAFRDMYSRASVFGADVNRRILFSQERIRTYYVDQADVGSLADLKDQLDPIRFDLIIDDGLHSAHANLNTTNFALSLLTADGAFVIEDINPDDLRYYQIAEAILGAEHLFDFLETKGGACICIMRRRGST